MQRIDALMEQKRTLELTHPLPPLAIPAHSVTRSKPGWIGWLR